MPSQLSIITPPLLSRSERKRVCQNVPTSHRRSPRLKTWLSSTKRTLRGRAGRRYPVSPSSGVSHVVPSESCPSKTSGRRNAPPDWHGRDKIARCDVREKSHAKARGREITRAEQLLQSQHVALSLLKIHDAIAVASDSPSSRLPPGGRKRFFIWTAIFMDDEAAARLVHTILYAKSAMYVSEHCHAPFLFHYM